MRKASRALTFCLLAISFAAPSVAADAPVPPPVSPPPPKLGLVLSGGGARGLAHVGVLKVLEREHIPVDLVAGTSMGAIIGGLYASGMSAEDLERELLRINWGVIFASRVDRQELSQRRKEEDFDFSAAIEFGMRDGELRAPQGTLSSRGLEILLRRLSLPASHVLNFDELPTPYRAVATDMENGSEHVLAGGSLALAMRSSMSVPGVFAPTEVDDHVLGDGGLVNNLPVDVARSMGATRVIAVNVGTPLQNRAALSSLVGVTAQMITILTEQNVRRSLDSLHPDDLLITPNLDGLSSADFARTKELIASGEKAAEALLPELRRLAVSPEAYAAWREARHESSSSAPVLAAVKFEGSEMTHPEQLQAQLESKPGQPFDEKRAERDARLLASSGDYERVDYHVERQADGQDLVFALEDKPWGPNYFRVGIDLSTDFSANSAFNLRISHNRHWLTDSGTEWRNQISIGQTPRLYSELYQPLKITAGGSSDWFVSAWGEIERRNLNIYLPDTGQQLASLSRQAGTVGFDLGQPWSHLGEIRLGIVHESWRIKPILVAGNVEVADGVLGQVWNETGLRLRAVVDQLDYANFPQRGYRVQAEFTTGRLSGGPVDHGASFKRAEGQITYATSWGPHTLNLHGRGLVAQQPEDSTQGPYTLGGFQQLSGYKPGQLTGQALLFGRASYYLRLTQAPILSRGVFVGGSLEAGNAWQHAHEMSMGDLRFASSLFIGTDTGLGPLYLAVGHAPQGGNAVYLFIGRP